MAKKQKTTPKKRPAPRKKPVTRAASATTARRPRILKRDVEFESDSAYLLKLVLFVLCGTLWLKLKTPIVWFGIPIAGIPIGLIAGFILVHSFEKLQSDRKIWYACLVVMAIICYFVPAGIMI